MIDYSKKIIKGSRLTVIKHKIIGHDRHEKNMLLPSALRFPFIFPVFKYTNRQKRQGHCGKEDCIVSILEFLEFLILNKNLLSQDINQMRKKTKFNVSVF